MQSATRKNHDFAENWNFRLRGTEHALFLVIMDTDPTSHATLDGELHSFMPLVLSIVSDFMRRVPKSVQREDLVAAGSMGLLHALRSEKHTCQEMLTAYARIRIRGAIIDELRRHDWSPRRRRITVTEEEEAALLAAGANVIDRTVKKPGVIVVALEDIPPVQALREDGPSPLEQLEISRSKTEIHQAIEKLPPRERIIVRMRFFDDVSSKSIAEKLGLSEARVSQLLTRATSLLKQQLKTMPATLAA